MYVSRGVSGRHPLRLRCKPELTKLVLQPPAEGLTGEFQAEQHGDCGKHGSFALPAGQPLNNGKAHV
jgi:hypothetical protein